MIRRNTQHTGYTLLELLVVIAAVIILGLLVMPTLRGSRGNTHIKGAADTVREMIAEARAHSINENRPYILSVSPEGTQLRVSVDSFGITDETVDATTLPPFFLERTFPADVVMVPPITDTPSVDDFGWQKVATFLPDGTCREFVVDFQLNEVETAPLFGQIRGLTGDVTINPAARQNPLPTP